MLLTNAVDATESAIVNGVDTLDFPLEFTGERDVTGAVLTVTDKVAELSGQLTDPTGVPAYDSTILAVAEDSRYWGPDSRRIVWARPHGQCGAHATLL